MSEETIRALAEKIGQSDEWQGKLNAAKSDDETVSIAQEAAKAYGYNVSDADIRAFINSDSSEELSESELEAAAGGGRRRVTWTAYCSRRR